LLEACPAVISSLKEIFLDKVRDNLSISFGGEFVPFLDQLIA